MATENVLSVVDYIVLVFFLLVSAAIGIYHATCSGRQSTSSEYFLADRSMSAFPVSVSLAVSVISAITFLGTPALSYVSGPAYWVNMFGRILSGIFTSLVICPVFYNLKITSIYEYMETRFNVTVRYITVFIHILSTLLVLGVIVYGPALALNVVTGLSLYGSIVAVGLVCTFYSTIGGIKAVVWSDLFQSSVMVIGFILIIVVGCVQVGGVAEVWSRAEQGMRTTLFDFRVDPTITLAFWPTVIGGAVLMAGYAGTNQNQAQRYLTCKDVRSAKLAVFLGFTWMGILENLAVVAGLVIFSFYYGCDPLTSGKISKTDQILPYYVVDVFGEVPGLTGLLVSAVFSASLSTVSTAINSIATVFGEDVVKKIWPHLPDRKFTMIVKIASVFNGFLFMALAFVASVSGSLVIKVGQSIVGALNGPVLATFLLGILVPRGNAKGATTGLIVGALLGMWLLIAGLFYPSQSFGLPFSTDLCPSSDSINVTHVYTTMYTSSEPPITTTLASDDGPADVTWLYSVSFLYLSIMTAIPTFLIAFVVSLLSCRSNKPVDVSLLSPVVLSLYRCLPPSCQEVIFLEDVYSGKGQDDEVKSIDVKAKEEKSGEVNIVYDSTNL